MALDSPLTGASETAGGKDCFRWKRAEPSISYVGEVLAKEEWPLVSRTLSSRCRRWRKPPVRLVADCKLTVALSNI